MSLEAIGSKALTEPTTPSQKVLLKRARPWFSTLGFTVEGSTMIFAAADLPRAMDGVVVGGWCKMLCLGDTKKEDCSSVPAKIAIVAATAAALARSLALKKFCAFSDKRISGARGAWYDGMSVSSGGRADR